MEGVGEGEGVVKGKSEVVKVESDVEKGSVDKSESDEVEENEGSGSSEDMSEKVEESGTIVGVDESGSTVEGSIVMEESKGGSPLLGVKSVGQATGEETSVEVSEDGSKSPEVGVDVSNVPVLDGNTSVSVESSVCVGVGNELTSKEVEKVGVDTGKSVAVSVEKVEKDRW